MKLKFYLQITLSTMLRVFYGCLFYIHTAAWRCILTPKCPVLRWFSYNSNSNYCGISVNLVFPWRNLIPPMFF